MKIQNKTPKSKKCIWCMEIKNYSEFSKYDKSTDGYRHMCYACEKIKKRKKTWVEENLM